MEERERFGHIGSFVFSFRALFSLEMLSLTTQIGHFQAAVLSSNTNQQSLNPHLLTFST